MNNIIKPGDYIFYANNNKKQCYGIVLELPVSEPLKSYVRESRGILSSSYIIRCDHKEDFNWAGHAEHYADKYHFDRIQKDNIITLIAKKPRHTFSVGDRVYSKEFHSIGTIRDIDSAAPEYSIEFDWNLNEEKWFPEGYKLHSCDGIVPSGRGWWCYEEDIMWVPCSFYQTLDLNNVRPNKVRESIENPLRTIFKLAAQRRYKYERNSKTW